MNGLYLNKSDNIENINEGINICPNLCLGGYMFRIIRYINDIPKIKNDENYNNAYDNIISNIDKDFNILIDNINLLIEQFKTYEKIIGFLGYNKEDLEISQQNQQKLNLMEKILSLMQENIKAFKKFKNQKYPSILLPKRISLKYFIKKYLD